MLFISIVIYGSDLISLVHVEHFAVVAAVQPENFTHIVRHLAKSLLALSQRVLHLLALGDVLGRADHAFYVISL